jgi:hypothetical protein
MRTPRASSGGAAVPLAALPVRVYACNTIRRHVAGADSDAAASGAQTAPQLAAASTIGAGERLLASAPIDADDRSNAATDDPKNIGVACRAVAQQRTQEQEDGAGEVVARALRSHGSGFLRGGLDGLQKRVVCVRCCDGPIVVGHPPGTER